MRKLFSIEKKSFQWEAIIIENPCKNGFYI
jgi:hypothetical protein